MSDAEFRAFLDWWMSCDPWPEGVSRDLIDDCLHRESTSRGYSNIVVAYHQHMKG